MLAIAIVPLMGAVGASVDYTRANAARAAFQTALNSTALALSKTASTQSPGQIQTAATDIFTALFSRPEVQNVAVAAQYSTTAGSKLVLDGSATIPTAFLHILGFDQIAISATSTSTWGNTRLRVALVLDNTGSMAQDNKMTALKNASQNLLTQLQNAATGADDVYVSIVPFNKDVNFGASNYDQAMAALGSVGRRQRHVQQHELPQPKHLHDRTARPGRRPTTIPGTAASPTAIRITTPPMTRRSPAPRSIRPSSIRPARRSSWASATTGRRCRARSTDMQPNGNTNQAIGLQAGWQSLTAAPFTVPAMDPNYKYTQAIILLSDGLNTEDRWYSERLLDRHAPAEDLRQHQGRRHHDLHRAGQYRRRSDLDAAAELRQRCQQVLPADLVHRDRHHLQPDRHRTLQSAAGDVTWFGQDRKPSVNDIA